MYSVYIKHETVGKQYSTDLRTEALTCDMKACEWRYRAISFRAHSLISSADAPVEGALCSVFELYFRSGGQSTISVGLMAINDFANDCIFYVGMLMLQSPIILLFYEMMIL